MSGHTPTQADREAAAAGIADRYTLPDIPLPQDIANICAGILAGERDDNSWVQAFAAHRIAACNSHGELVEALEGARLAVEHLASLERLRGHATATTAGVLERINAALSKAKAKGEAL